MTDWIIIKTEAELKAALKKDKNALLDLVEGSFSLTLKAGSPWLRVAATVSLSMICEETSQPHIEAWGTSQPHIEAWGTGQPHIVARETSQPHIVAWGTSQPHIVAWETSQPHIEAWGTSQPHIVARETSQPHIVARETSQPHIVARETSQPHIVARETSQPHIVAWETSQPHIVARETSQPHIVAWETSEPHIEAWGTSQPHIVARETSQPHIEAWETSQPHIVAWETSQPHIEAWGTSQPHIEARETSQPHIVARETSQPHIVAKSFAQLQVSGPVRVTAAATVSVVQRGTTAKVTGGNLQIVDLSTAVAWCDYYGVDVINGIATLFKAVDPDYSTNRARPAKISYAPGQVPVAPDWDGGKAECGRGLHFCAHPKIAKERFNSSATHAIACPVRLEDIAVHPDGIYPEKVKARGCCAPVYEVDWDGRRLAEAAEAAE